MFGEYYKLPENAFGVTPGPRFLFAAPSHREALASLLCGLRAGRGFMTLVAKPGMGKTATLLCLLERLRDTARTALVFQTQFNPSELLRHVLLDLGADGVAGERVAMHQQLNGLLLEEAERGRRVVVIIDEAQHLDEETLESVRLLSNLENPGTKLIEIILAGQPLLADKLALPRLAQLRQRVAVMATLKPLSPTETEAYIQHRLCVCGYRGPSLFEPDALRLIVAVSGGIPRNINTLCFNALSIGCALRMKRINAGVVCEAMADLDVTSQSSCQAAPARTTVATPGQAWRRGANTTWRQEKVGSSRWAIRRTVCSCECVAMSVLPTQMHEQAETPAQTTSPVSEAATIVPASIPELEANSSPCVAGNATPWVSTQARGNQPGLIVSSQELVWRLGAGAVRGIQGMKPHAAMVKHGAVRSWNWLNGNIGSDKRVVPSRRASR